MGGVGESDSKKRDESLKIQLIGSTHCSECREATFHLVWLSFL